MRPRGRPPAVRGVYSFEEDLLIPDELVLDTSFVVEALFPSQRLHAACQAFLERIAEAGRTIYFNRLLELELAEAVYCISLKERHGQKHWKRYRADGRARNRAARLLEDTMAAWGEVLNAVTWTRIEVEEVMPDVQQLMKLFGLKSYDAVHVATAWRADVIGVVTLDTDFARTAPDLIELYVPSSKVRGCRTIRRRFAPG